MSDLNRRQFVALTVAGACACRASAEPSTKPAKPSPAPIFDAGSIDDYAEEGAYDTFGKSHKVLIIRNLGKLYASSARCTHKACTVKAVSRTEIICPCHGSAYDLNGVPLEGPARSSLFRLAIERKDNRVVVNTAKQFAEADWDQPGAFVEIKP